MVLQDSEKVNTNKETERVIGNFNRKIENNEAITNVPNKPGNG